MITDADVKKLAKVFATKDDIQDLGQKIDDLKTRLDVLEDNVTGEIAKLHDENLITSSYRNSIEDHETRIGHLEQKVAVAN